jgi:ribosomal protein S18 acetylase RimI-like enzyme
MAIKPLRRLQLETGDSLYDRLGAGVLGWRASRVEVDETEREHPHLVVERDGNLLTAYGSGTASLAYSFRNAAAFADEFPSMFEEILPMLRRELHAETVRIRLEYAPARAVVEPVLKRLSFSPRKPWLGFLLDAGKPPKLPATKGVTYRVGGLDDFGDVVRLDRECFPNTPMPEDVLRKVVAQQRLLVATSAGEVAGIALYTLEPDRGYLTVLAVGERWRGRAIGASLTLRVAKALFAEGAPRLDLKTDEDNATAIRLYRSLGFRQEGAGRDYDRPTDPRLIAAMRKASEGTLIRFGGWR